MMTRTMLPRVCTLLLLSLFCDTFAATSASNENSSKETPLLKRTLPAEESFFGKLQDHEETRKQLARDFFATPDEPEPPVPVVKLLKKTSKQEVPANKSDSPVTKQKVVQTKDELPPVVASKPTVPVTPSSKFSCTRRALLLYKSTIYTISHRLQSLSSEFILESDDNTDTKYFLQLRVSVREMSQLKRHLNELQNILETAESPKVNVKSSQPSTGDEAIRFCKNLDAVEVAIRDLTVRLSMHDPTRPSVARTERLLSSMSHFLPSSSYEQTFYLVSSSVLCLLFFGLFPYRLSLQGKALYVGLYILIVCSMAQFFWKEKRDFTEAQVKKWNLGNSPTATGEDFYEQFNFLHFIIKFLLESGFLLPFKWIATHFNDTFELMIDGTASSNWLSPGAWFRAILFSNLLKIFSVLLLMVGAVWFFTLFRPWILVWGLVSRYVNAQQRQQSEEHREMLNDDTRQSQQLHIPTMADSSRLPLQSRQLVVNITNHYHSGNGVPNRSDIPLLRQRPPHQQQPSIEDEEYLSAEDGDD